MATERYEALWVTPPVKAAIKKEAKKQGRTIIGELKMKYKIK